jgi:hypothetical protein
VAPVPPAARPTAATAPAATQPLTQDDSYRTAALLDEAADLLSDKVSARRWQSAVDQLLDEDADIFGGDFSGDE